MFGSVEGFKERHEHGVVVDVCLLPKQLSNVQWSGCFFECLLGQGMALHRAGSVALTLGYDRKEPSSKREKKGMIPFLKNRYHEPVGQWHVGLLIWLIESTWFMYSFLQ